MIFSSMTRITADINELADNMFTSPRKRFIGELVAKTVREEVARLQGPPKAPHNLAAEGI